MINMLISFESGGYGIEGIKKDVSHPVAQAGKQSDFFCDTETAYLSCMDLNCSSPSLYLI